MKKKKKKKSKHTYSYKTQVLSAKSVSLKTKWVGNLFFRILVDRI